MSWQAYVDNNLVGSGQITAGAILGLDGSQWARSAKFPNLDTATKEAMVLVKENFEKAGNAQSKGIIVGKQKYMCVRADPRSVYGKAPKGGIVCVKTGKAVIVGIYDETIQTGNATKVVEDLADYLISVGY